MLGYSGSVCKQLDTQGALIVQSGSLRQESIWGRCLEREVARGPQVFLPTSKHHPAGPGQASKMGSGPDHEHTPLARSELVPRDHAPSNRATKKVKTTTVVPMECNNQGSNSKGHEKHPVDCLEAHITICAQSGIGKEIARKVTDSWTEGTKQNYQQMFEQWCPLCHKRGLLVLKICVINLVDYLVDLQVTHDYAYITLCMHASTICRILQPTEQTRASTVPLVKQLLKEVFRKKPLARV